MPTESVTIVVSPGISPGTKIASNSFRVVFWSCLAMFGSLSNAATWIGNFRTRLEADRAMLQIKEVFDKAFIIRPGRS